ncbi:BatD family protein [Mangrovitalea sediminis]|uniref:BatD family protein n=1 Tax=Mangrovitalea sediminis TaxID=1982043 RepID=UPI000BE60797|nr:BatD family protein [Mangrovitalea sediminis]
MVMRRMVMRPTLAVLSVFCLWLASLSLANAAGNKLDVSVDRTRIHADETLTMTVKGKVDIHLSFQNLLNFNMSQIPKPDLGDLEQNFDIVNQGQNYNVQTINGQVNANVDWTFVLAPKRTGVLTIPALSYKGATSDPIKITVLPGSSATGGAQGPASLTVTVDKKEVYEQEQVVLTEVLEYRGPLFNGNLSDVSVPDAILQPLGQPDKFTRMHNGEQYQVLKREYAIYPQKTGTLTIPSQTFTGQGQNPMTGSLRYLHANSAPIDISVKAPPASFKGSEWLPATSLILTDKLSEAPNSIQVGDSVTRTITIHALGQTSAALPPLNLSYPAVFKSYPDQPKLHSTVNNGTLDSTRTESTALVPMQAGKVTLPAVKVHWWDTINDVERVAEIPPKTLDILPAAGSSAQPQSTSNGNQPSSSPAQPPAPAQAPAPAGKSPATVPAGTIWTSPWLWVSAVLLLVWLVTMALWLRERRRGRGMGLAEGLAAKPTESDLYGPLRQAILEGDSSALNLLPRWAQRHFHNPALQTVADVKAFFNDGAFSAGMDALERRLYAHPDHRESWDGKPLVSRLETLSRGGSSRKPSVDDGLPPLYSQRFKAGDDRSK